VAALATPRIAAPPSCAVVRARRRACPGRGRADDREIASDVALGETRRGKVRRGRLRRAAAQRDAEAEQHRRQVVQLAGHRDEAGHEVDRRGEMDEAGA
jgi:hypothetical protein